MKAETSRQRQAKVLRIFRKIHRTTGAALFLMFFVVSITGLLLAWKKNSGGLILPESSEGVSTDLATWLPLDSLYVHACRYLHDSVSTDLSLDLDRIDVRQDKGMVKFVFKDHYWGLQLDGTTGALLQVEHRLSDMIENIHDGSILDYLFKTPNGELKLVYSSVSGFALLTFTITGFWLWYGPKRMRRVKEVNE